MNLSQPPLPPAGAVSVILPAAGRSRRFQTGHATKKIFASLAGRPVWERAAARLRRCPAIGTITLVISEDDRPRWEDEHAEARQRLDINLVVGGAERVDSVAAALETLPAAEWIAVHDAARPLLSDHDLQAVLAAAFQDGAALLASPVRGTLKRDLGDLRSCQTLDRTAIWEAQTPQVFRGDWLRDAYRRWRGRPVTDDAQLVERAGYPVRLVPGADTNLKLTRPQDLRIAEALWAALQPELDLPLPRLPSPSFSELPRNETDA
jgi:2-C-methyl-D-erythritol 4-phosphate cytidylyltransferase